ncbi:hypothetical protein CEK28_08725 [Xenophilus sp. AP218F]|nr:hypothetical protein CEK28_08725 [Xenophilus sp. AP218F]
MSYGLQVFDGSGRALIDSNVEGVMFGQVLTAAPNQTAVYAFPQLAGCTALLLMVNSGYHSAQADYSSGFPRITLSPYAWGGRVSGSTRYLVVFK